MCARAIVRAACSGARHRQAGHLLSRTRERESVLASVPGSDDRRVETSSGAEPLRLVTRLAPIVGFPGARAPRIHQAVRCETCGARAQCLPALLGRDDLEHVETRLV